MAASYIPAEEVTSPARRWSLVAVLDDPQAAGGFVLALGKWDDHFVLAARWHGTADKPAGAPTSRGFPIWFILPDRYYPFLLSTLSEEKRKLAAGYLKA